MDHWQWLTRFLAHHHVHHCLAGRQDGGEPRADCRGDLGGVRGRSRRLGSRDVVEEAVSALLNCVLGAKPRLLTLETLESGMI